MKKGLNHRPRQSPVSDFNQRLSSSTQAQLTGYCASGLYFVCTMLFEAIPQVFIRMFGADGELYTRFAITNKRWGDSHNYELCVDSSIGVEESANLILRYLKLL